MLYHRLFAVTAVILIFASCMSSGGAGRSGRGAKKTFSATDPNNSKGHTSGKVDAIPSPVTGEVKISKPYVIFGVTYYPLATSDGYVQEGVSSWYGPNFQGKKSANGEIYDMQDKTCAHLILPFNTMVKVENLENGKSTIVRVNDRGPFAKNRIIDLSRKGAEEIGMIAKGTAKVRLTALSADGSMPRGSGKQYSGKMLKRTRGLPVSPHKAGNFFIQAGSYSRADSANKILSKIPKKYSSLASINERASSVGTLHRVVIGPFKNRGEAAKAAREIKINTRSNTMITSGQ